MDPEYIAGPRPDQYVQKRTLKLEVIIVKPK